MASLYNRATPRQVRVLRIIEGAIRNATHAHPKLSFDPRLTRSIAKRAAGTLTAGWQDVLAVPRERSESGGGEALIPSRTEPASTCLRRAGASQLLWRTPLWRLKLAIGEATMRARKEGRTERVEAFVDVMRLIAIIIEADQPPNRRSRYTIP